MHKIDTETASGNEFVDGNKSEGIQATKLNAAWFNTVQRELVKVVEAAGLALSNADDQQVYKSLLILVCKTILATTQEGTLNLVSKSGNSSLLSASKFELNSGSTSESVDADAYGLTVTGLESKSKISGESVETPKVDFGSMSISEVANSSGSSSTIDVFYDSSSESSVSLGASSSFVDLKAATIETSQQLTTPILKVADKLVIGGSGAYGRYNGEFRVYGNFICSEVINTTKLAATGAVLASQLGLVVYPATTSALLKDPSSLLTDCSITGYVVLIRNDTGADVEIDSNIDDAHSDDNDSFIVRSGEFILYGYNGSAWKRVW